MRVKEKPFHVGIVQTEERHAYSGVFHLLYEIELPLKVRKINMVLCGSVGKRVALANIRVVDLIPHWWHTKPYALTSLCCKPLWIKCLLNSVLSRKYTTIPSHLGRKQ